MLNLFDEKFHSQKLPAIATWCSIIGIPLAIISIVFSSAGVNMLNLVLIATFLLVMYVVASIIYQVSIQIKEKALNRSIEHINARLADISNRRRSFRKYDKIKKELTSTCDKIAEAFRENREGNFRVCIKQIVIRDEDLYVRTIVRDPHTSAHDLKASEFDSHTDRINDNRDFVEILTSAESAMNASTDAAIPPIYFFSNNLSIEPDYYNSHLSNDFCRQFSVSNKKRQSEWPLSYISTIVTPIYSPEKRTINGFMCIDCNKPDAFEPKDDIEMLYHLSIHISFLVEKAILTNQRNRQSSHSKR